MKRLKIERTTTPGIFVARLGDLSGRVEIRIRGDGGASCGWQDTVDPALEAALQKRPDRAIARLAGRAS